MECTEEYLIVGTKLNHNNASEKIDGHSINEFVDFFHNAPIALHWLSGTGHIIWANKTEMNALGYEAHEYIGHHIMEVMHTCVDGFLSLM
jgi:transcriptional regulator with PAS, ATPase and Fis domain